MADYENQVGHKIDVGLRDFGLAALFGPLWWLGRGAVGPGLVVLNVGLLLAYVFWPMVLAWWLVQALVAPSAIAEVKRGQGYSRSD